MRNLIMGSVFMLFQNFAHIGDKFEVKWCQKGLKIAYLPRKRYQKLNFAEVSYFRWET